MSESETTPDVSAPEPTTEVSAPEATTNIETATLEQTPQVPSQEASAEGAAETAANADSTSDSTTVEPSSAADPTDGGTPPAVAVGADGETPKKKKKRRRKKKKKPVDPNKPPAPFASFFADGPRKHAFSAGEIVAGRVSTVDADVFVVDLFGKASAIVDAREPHEIAEIPEEEKKAMAAAVLSQSSDDAAKTAAFSPETVIDEDAMTIPGYVRAASLEDAPDPGPTANYTGDDSITATGMAAASKDAVVESSATPAAEVATPSDATSAEATPNSDATSAQATPNADATSAEATPNADATSAEATPANAPVADAGKNGKNAKGKKGDAKKDKPEPTPEDLVRWAAADAAALLSDEQQPPAEGAIFRGRVASVSESGHIAIINRLIDRPRAKQRVAQSHDDKKRVTGVVFGFNRGGFDVIVEGIRAFCPAGSMSLGPVENPVEFVGKKFEFTVPPKRSGGRSIIVSRRGILERDARKKARERMKELKVGDKLKGKVVIVRDYGVIVNVGDALEGLVHQSEVSHRRGVPMAELTKVGDQVDVEVLKVEPGTRKDRYGKLSLSIKRCLPDPWEAFGDILKVGYTKKGKVTRTTDFGAFVQLAEGLEGLLHISELGGKDLKHAKYVLKDNQEIDVVIDRVDRKQRRISLSRLSEADAKRIADGEFDPTAGPVSTKQGAHVTVVIERVEHHGMIVQVKGVLGKRGRGFISNRDLPDGPSGDRKKIFAPGSEVQVRVMGTERNGALKCSVKHLKMDEERKAVKEYRKEAAGQGLGTFGDLLKAKLGQKD